jgi:hypothetical protein
MRFAPMLDLIRVNAGREAKGLLLSRREIFG